MYLTRVEKNRLAHSENGSTMYMSREAANKLAHATNGNTAARTSEDIINERECITIKDHLCKGRTWNLLQCSRKPMLNSEFCHQHANTWHLRHGRMGNPISATLKAFFGPHPKVTFNATQI